MEFTRKELLNAKSASIALKDCNGQEIEITGVMVSKIVDNEGVERDALYAKSADGNYYCTISATVLKIADDLTDIIADEGKALVRVVSRKAKSGREFVSLVVL